MLGLITALLIAGNATAGSAPTEVFERDDVDDCDAVVSEPVPVAYAMPLETTPRLDVRVHVVLDGIPVDRGEQIMARVAEAYDAIGIDLKATYQEVSIEPDSVDDGATGTGGVAHGPALMSSVKTAVGEARPWGSDVVFAMTSDDIAGAAGFADCIGGVRSASQSFAVGQAAVDPAMEAGPVSHQKSAKIAAHEIAHLLGAHHHYANCAEAPRDPGGGITLLVSEACTVMINDVGLASLGWSTLEAAVVRGHVAEFAIGAGMGPEPVHQRDLKLKINKKGVGKGTIDSATAECLTTSVVTLERKSAGQWNQVARDESFSSGGYAFPDPLKRGTYRTSIPSGYFEGQTHRESCTSAISPEVTFAP